MTTPDLKQAPADSVKPKINWARIEEADNFAKTVKLFRQGKYDEDSFRRFRLQHGAYGTRMTSDYAMVRIKLPAGEIYPHQFEKISQLSEQYSIGSAHFSTRENIQLHWVILEDVSEIFRGLAEVGLTSREACGNSVRNVMCSPLSGVCPDEEFDSTPYALATARFFLRNPMAQNLPRKFKFNFTCCEKHGMVRMVDVGLIPQIREIDGSSQRGFKIFLGGGLGNKSYVGHQLEEFTSDEDLLYTSIAVMRIFDRLGDRKNLARNRMRYLVNDMGWEKFQNLVFKERAIVRATQSIVTQLDVDITPDEIKRPIRISDESGGTTPDGYARWLKTNTVKQKQSDYRSVFITLEAGDITANQLRALSDLIRDFSSEGKARCGFVQNVALRYVLEDDLPRLYSKLLEVGLAKSGALTMTAPIGCSGTTSCNLALTNSHRLAKEIQRKFLELKLDEDDDLNDSSIKISGCPNSCGQHGIATIGFFGGGARVGKDMYPNYQMSLGGRSDGDTMLGEICLRIPAKRVIPIILKIIELFKEKKKPGDTLKSWIHRVVNGNEDSDIKSINDIKKVLEPLIIPPTKDDDPDFYLDYGSDTSYHTKTGKGECAA
ncbi:MAG: nitrite/sulfite reductase [Nitrosopumilus sp.]|uniref:Ferredoxin--nitrite reductase n=1 Tax=Nitrosopumilus zosterae TaxID=718286 RepID=A0A2S2KNY3_9ARCH|nr:MULTISPECIES: nitrite/sulfite reductase [Nitrosopumilus]MCV0367559.1 nitrite/sulfite reductase [Nitrosopumilus sp.]BDQ31181.1 nitrite/sulfite reductase [Nitrosopumilus zosterae]GBH33393.1 ferredoxin--nitrite reductase [Nitrosopumilus zosterae]